jgi:hypothetical protein
VRSNGQTVYTWNYQRLLFGRPIALDVLGVAPIDRLGELSWLGPWSVVIYGLLLGLVAHAYTIQNFDRWMLLLTLGAFTGAYPLMYFAQEFILFGVILPAVAMLSLTLTAAIYKNLQGILITILGMAFFTAAMLLIPKMKRSIPPPAAPEMPAPLPA